METFSRGFEVISFFPKVSRKREELRLKSYRLSKGGDIDKALLQSFVEIIHTWARIDVYIHTQMICG
jgi:hypothetical protein